jgi:hypothetical protein
LQDDAEGALGVVAGDVEEAGDVGGRRRASGIFFVGVAGHSVLRNGGGEAI